MKKVAIVTGANRGIGKEIARQLSAAGMQVILTARNMDSARKAAEEIGNGVVPFALDVTQDESAKTLALFVQENYAALDVLVNNAAILHSGTAWDLETIHTEFHTNYFGTIRMIQHLLPLLKKSNDGRIINFSSHMAQLDDLANGFIGQAPYRLTKAAINSYTIILAHELENTNIKVNVMSPGWVKTDMGGASAPRTVQQGADTALWLATEPNIPTGKFFSDREEISW